MEQGNGGAAPSPRDWENWWKDQAYVDVMRRRALDPAQEMEQVKQLVRLLRPWIPPDVRVLDVGCGVGHFFPSLRRIAPKLHYTGVDVTPSYIEAARGLFADAGARFEVGDVYGLRFADRSFDLVLGYMLLVNLPHYREPLAELARVCGKRLYLRTLLCKDEEYIVRRYKKDGTPFYYNIYDEDRFVAALRDQGFASVTVHDDEFGLQIPKGEAHATYTLETPHGRLQVSGNLIMTWKVIEAIR